MGQEDRGDFQVPGADDGQSLAGCSAGVDENGGAAVVTDHKHGVLHEGAAREAEDLYRPAPVRP